MRLITEEAYAQVVKALWKEIRNYRTHGDGDGAPEYLHDTLATLQSAPEVEAAVWQYRTKPNWDTFAPWCHWQLCSKGNYEDYKRACERKGDWAYQARELYATKEKT